MDELSPLTGPRRSRKFLVLDIESKDGDSQRAGFTRPFMVGVYDGENYYPFFDSAKNGAWDERYFYEGGCVDQAMRFILQRKYRGWHVYAHNAGKFDYLFLLPWLMLYGEELGFHFNLIPVASAIQVLDIWRPRRREGSAKKSLSHVERVYRGDVWRFLDSYRLIPIGLDRAAKTFRKEAEDRDLPSGKLKHDLHLPEWDKRWIDYNRIDCVQLFRILVRFHHYIENVLLGDVGITAPATSMKLLRRRYLSEPVPRSQDTHEFVRKGYFGGRVEVYRKAGKKLRYYDINSSYPAAMLNPMPAGHATLWEGEPPERFLRDQIGFVEAVVEVPEHLEIPPLPVRDPEIAKGKLVFPVGRLAGVWEWDELKLGLELGCKIAVWHQSVWYEPVDLFGEFVRDLYQYRDTSRADYDPGLAQVVKIMLNSCYGKFGMRTLRKTLYRWDDPDLPENAYPATNHPESVVWWAEEEVDAQYILPQVAARVTACARVQLYRVIQQIQALGGNVYYCDTDSVITDVDLSTSSELGALKDEYPAQSGKLFGKFLGPKLYLLWSDDGMELVKAKGLQKRTRENVERLAAGETIFQDRLEKIGSLVRAGFSRGPKMLKVPRRHHQDDGKREALKDGSSRPFKVDMW